MRSRARSAISSRRCVRLAIAIAIAIALAEGGLRVAVVERQRVSGSHDRTDAPGSHRRSRPTAGPRRRTAIARSYRPIGAACRSRPRPHDHRADELSPGVPTHRDHGRRRVAGHPGQRRLWWRQRHTAATDDRERPVRDHRARVRRQSGQGARRLARSQPVLVPQGLRRQEFLRRRLCRRVAARTRAEQLPDGAGLSAAKLTTARSDGGPQILYNGHPLYRLTGTPKPGDTNGQRVTAFGAAWFAVSRAGQVDSRPGSKPGGGGIS
jgi:hypothetical protein